MKHFLKGAAIVVGMMIVNIIINVFCNMHDVELDSGVVTVVSVICSLLIYHAWISKENREQK